MPGDLSSRGRADVWLVGAGAMAEAYSAVLHDLGVDVRVIGRGERSAEQFTQSTGRDVVTGGLRPWLATAPAPARMAVVATPVAALADTTEALIAAGVERILVEKPAGLDAAGVNRVADAARRQGAEVYVAYNRRFYRSVQLAREMLAADGGVLSYTFEFTELGDRIAASAHPDAVKRSWFLANSTHVVDLAFHLGGSPASLVGQVAGGLDWHPAAARFCGCGETAGGALFSYRADWDAPGRWSVELMTRRRRLILSPMEQLRVQERNSFAIEEVELDDDLDLRFKPGLHRQVTAFLEPLAPPELLTVADHARAVAGPYAAMIDPDGPFQAPRP